MAIQRDITADDGVFFDTDVVLKFAITSGDPAVPVDVATWTFAWVLRKKVDSADPAIIEKTTGAGITVTGTYDADPEVNTQRVEVEIEDTDTYDPDGSPVVLVKAGDYVHALKRIDDGVESVLTFGKFKLLRAAAWE